ncbi:aromatic-ring-hydroxylating dioxygenase subunit beta [Sphingoaurantiacus capsulatus]|uniref:Aromatic-ring-hydroxylating dioxygenase subunit beta n=1 Tax=Sphingoaurantiacus capsulatus TaxID=1771310 RepID=A0ABV7X556_9SPHN
MTVLPTRAEVEDFLFREARLLDEWRLTEWSALFTEDGEYHVPSTDLPDGDANSSLFLINDDHHRLVERAIRLLKRAAHAEFPRSKTRHMIANVEVEAGEDGLIRVRCNFVVHRSRGDRLDVFPGHAIYDLRPVDGGGFAIRRKRAVLDCDTLRLQGRISIIL